MKTINLYEDKHSFLNQIAPLVKMSYVIVAIMIPVILQDFYENGFFVLLSVILLLGSKVLQKTIPILCMSGFILLTIVFIQGAFRVGNVTPVFHLGIITFYEEGLVFASAIVLRVMNVIFGMSVFMLTTKPSDFVDDLVRMGMSPRVGYIFLSLFLLIPHMSQRVTTISEAQRSRGMETKGNLFVRIKAFLPLLSPVIMSSLMDARERSIALEVRGFNSHMTNTHINEPIRSKWDKIIMGGFMFMVVFAIVWRMV